MIPEQPKPKRRRKPTPPPRMLEQPAAPAPSWLHEAARAPRSLEEATFVAGTALGALDLIVRKNQLWAGLWRHRLALAAATLSVRQMGRKEEEAALRDAVHLTRSGDTPGPAGEVLLAWRGLVTSEPETLLTYPALCDLFQRFGRPSAARADTLALLLSDRVGKGQIISAALDAFELALQHSPSLEAAPLISDAVLARAFGWERGVPLLASELPHTALVRPAQGETPAAAQERRLQVLSAYACAALAAIDFSAELGEKAERLLDAAPQLRAKASDDVVEKLLSEDALTASYEVPGITRWGMHRIFERLISFGVLRELTGRNTFRIYGV